MQAPPEAGRGQEQHLPGSPDGQGSLCVSPTAAACVTQSRGAGQLCGLEQAAVPPSLRPVPSPVKWARGRRVR